MIAEYLTRRDAEIYANELTQLYGPDVHFDVVGMPDPAFGDTVWYVLGTGTVDGEMFAVYAPSLPDIARRIGPLLGPETAVVTAMNGVPWWFFLNAKGALAGLHLKAIDPDGTVAQAIPTRRVIGCVLYIAASVDEPGIIRHSNGRQLFVGEPNNQLRPRLARLADWLPLTGSDCRETLDIQ